MRIEGGCDQFVALLVYICYPFFLFLFLWDLGMFVCLNFETLLV